MTNNVQMVALHLKLNCIYNKLFFFCALNPINTQNPPNWTQDTLDETKLYKNNKHWLLLFHTFHESRMIHWNPINLSTLMSNLLLWTFNPIPSSIVVHMQNGWIESSLVNFHPFPFVMLHLEARFPHPRH